jgi:hypothetical protein
MTGDRSSSDDRAGRVEGATFAPVPVAAGRKRPILVGGLIAGSLAVLVALGTIGRGGSVAPAVGPKAETEGAAVASSLPVPVPGAAADTAAIDPFGVTVVTTGSRITVKGTLGVHADLVTVTLETAAGTTADWMLLGIRNPDGEIRLDESPPFSALFDLAKAVVGAPLWVRVDAYNDAGARVASVRQPVLVRWARVGPLGFRQR